MRRRLNWLRDTRGVTSIEYALIAALVAVGLIGSLQAVGGNLKSAFATIANGLDNGDADRVPPAATTNAVKAGS